MAARRSRTRTSPPPTTGSTSSSPPSLRDPTPRRPPSSPRRRPAAPPESSPPPASPPRFSEAMTASTINGTTVQLRDSGGQLLAATVTWDAANNAAVLDPTPVLAYSTAHTVTVKGGASGVKDVAGNPLAADFSWTFTTQAAPPPPPQEGPGGPILVIGNATNPFSRYYAEILRAEGLNAFKSLDISVVDASVLAGYDVAILGEMALTAGQVTMLTDWVNGGGNLIAMRPGQAARRTARPHHDDQHPRPGLPADRHRGLARARHRRADHPVPRHRRPLHPRPGHGGGDAVLERDHRHHQPGGHPPLGGNGKGRAPSPSTSPAPSCTRARATPRGRATRGTGSRPSGPTTSSTAPRRATCRRTG